MVLTAYITTNWAIHESNNNNCKKHIYYGINTMEAGQEGKNCTNSETKDKYVSCSELKLDSDGCSRYEGVTIYSGVVLGLISAFLIVKLCSYLLSRSNTHNRIIYLLLLLCFFGDLLTSIFSFVTIGEFSYTMDRYPSDFPTFHFGYGWYLYLTIGLITFLMCGLTFATLEGERPENIRIFSSVATQSTPSTTQSTSTDITKVTKPNKIELASIE